MHLRWKAKNVWWSNVNGEEGRLTIRMPELDLGTIVPSPHLPLLNNNISIQYNPFQALSSVSVRRIPSRADQRPTNIRRDHPGDTIKIALRNNLIATGPPLHITSP